MNTDNFIRALAADAQTESGAPYRQSLRLFATSAIVVAILFALFFPIRDDLTEAGASPTFGKLVFTLLLLAAGARGATILMRPDATLRDAVVWLAAPFLAIFVLIGTDIALYGGESIGERIIGSSALSCLISVGLLSVAPLGAFLYGLRDGAAARPDLSGALAGIAAGGLSASFYALYCSDDSPLFFGVWYGLAIALVGVVGAMLGRRVLRW